MINYDLSYLLRPTTTTTRILAAAGTTSTSTSTATLLLLRPKYHTYAYHSMYLVYSWCMYVLTK